MLICTMWYNAGEIPPCNKTLKIPVNYTRGLSPGDEKRRLAARKKVKISEDNYEENQQHSF